MVVTKSLTGYEIKRRFETFKQAVRRIPPKLLVKGMQDILLERKSLFNDIYEVKFKKFITRGELLFYISNIVEASILYGNEYRSYNEQELEKKLRDIFKATKEYFIDCYEIRTHEDAEYNIVNFLFRMEDYQISYQLDKNYAAIAFHLFCELTKTDDQKLKGFQFFDKFKLKTGVELEKIFQALFIIYVLSTDKHGWFSDETLNLANNNIFPACQSLSKTFRDFSSTIEEFKLLKSSHIIHDNHKKIFELNVYW